MYVHAVDLRREQSGFVPAGSCPDLHDDVFIIIGVLGQKQDLQFPFQLLDPCLGFVQLFLGQLPHLFIRLFLQHRQAVLHILPALLIFLKCFYDGSQVALLLHQLPETLCVIGHVRLLQFSHDLLIANQ